VFGDERADWKLDVVEEDVGVIVLVEDWVVGVVV
jgi:hypothetical protein